MPNDYGLDKLSTDELLGVSKTPAAPSAPPTPSSAPVTDYGLDKLPANELLGTPSDLAAESAKAAALFEASFGNPTEEVKRRNLSAAIQRMSGEYVPPSVMDTADAQRKADRLSADHATRASPRTSAFLSVPENAAVAMQDAKTLAQIEAIVGGDPLRSAEIALKRLAMSSANLGAWGFDVAGVAPDIAGEGLAAVGLPNEYNVFRDMASGSRRHATAARAAVDYFTPEARNMVERAAASAGTSAGTSLQLLPLAMSGAGAPMAAAFGLGTFGESYTKARDQGKNPIQALQYAIPQGAYEALFEMAPAAFLADALKTAPGLKQFVAGLAAREVPTEMATTVAQNLNDWVTFNPNKSVADFIAEQPEALAETIIATVMGAGVQAGIIHGAQRTTGQFQQMQEERRAKQLQETLTGLMDQAKNVKSDPVTFQNFMVGVTDNATVFINADALQDTLAQNKMDVSVLPSLAEQLAQPSVTGDVEVPIGELMTAFAGTPAQEQVVQHARVRQDDLSAAEQAQFGDMGAFFKKQGEAVMEKQKANEAFVSERQEIEADIVKQLGAASPFQEREHKYYAQMMGAFYSTAADLMGTTPKQIQARWAPNILGATEAAQPGTLTQGFDHGNAMLNVGLDVGATDRAQKIDADFVRAEIEKMGVQVLSAEQVEGEYEYEGKPVKELTYVPHLSRPLTEAEVNQLAIATGQEAIGHYADGAGNLWGPNAANWGDFNPEFFKDQRGTKLSDAQKELAQSQSTRRPTTKRAAEDHLGEVSLTVDYSKIEPEKTEQNMKLVSQYPGIRFKARKADGRAEEFIQHVTNNLLWLHDQIPAEIRQRSKLWYDGARAITDRWSAKYGKTDAQIAAILAVYSPQKDWFVNVSLAERTLDIVANQQDTAWSPEMTEVADKILADEKFSMLRGTIEGKKLSELKDRLEQAAWLRTFDEAHNNRGHRLVTPEGGFIEFATSAKGAEKKTGWPGFGTIIKALYVIDDGSPKMIDNALGGEHKVRSFYNNIFHPTSDQGFVTIDTHAVAAGLLRPLSGNSVEVTHNFGGAGTATSAATGMSGTYAYYQEAYRRAAEARGLRPREMQSIAWEAVRELYTGPFKRDAAKMAVVDKLWSEYEKGKRDLDSVRAGILNLAGGVEQPSWVNRDSGISPEGWASTYTGELLGDSVPRRDTGGVDAGARERAAAGISGSELAQLNRNVGAVAGPVVGIHYSKAPRTSLSSSAFGQGMPGAERERIAASNDPRIKQRVAFYVNTGNGIKPEDGVGSHAHSATLRNLYDADADVLKIWRNAGDDMNKAESAVLDAGFDGYLTRNFGNQGAVVMLGRRDIGAASVKAADVSTVAEQPPSPEIPKMKQAAMAIMQNRALPNGRQSVESWRRDLERSDPDTAALIAWDKIPAGDYYKDQIAGQLWQTQWFYSALQRAIEGAPAKVFSTGKATAQWLAANAGKMTVKKEELEATGITDWLETQGRITKEQVVEFLKQGGVKIEEVVLGKGQGGSVLPIGDEWGAFTPDGSRIGITKTKAEAEAIVAEAVNTGKFEQWQLPGGENYREWLLALPSAPADYEYQVYGAFPQGPFKTEESAQAYVDRLTTLGADEPGIIDSIKKFPFRIEKVQTYESRKQGFRSSHFDQPNILAHIRTNERTDADGKRVLFIEEIQSDWAQKGRKNGFNVPVTGYQVFVDGVAAGAPYESKIDAYDHKTRALKHNAPDKVEIREVQALQSAQSAGNKGLVPLAPFVTDTKSWTALALKRMIAHAVENGFDSVAWTTGEQQAARYDLSKQVSKIEALNTSDGKTSFVAYGLDGEQLAGETVPTRDLPDHVGKDLAEKISKQPAGYHEYEGLDLKVGGEGMKGYYDGIVPQVANDVLKKLGGGKVQQMNFYQKAGADYVMRNVKTGKLIENTRFTKEEADAADPAYYTAEYSPREMDTEVEPGEFGIQPGFQITPAMREAVGQGLPLFAEAAGPRRGSFNPLTFDLRLLADANRSTFIHEASHFFMAAYIDMASQPDAPPALKQYVEDLLGYLFKNVPGGEQVGGEGLGQAERVLTWQEFGAYLQTVEAHDAFGKVSAQEKKQWAAAGEQWRLMALDAKTLKPVDADVDFSRPIIVAPDGDVLDGRHRRAAATGPIAAWVAYDGVLRQEVGADNTQPGPLPEGRTNIERWNAMTLDQQRAYWEFFAEGWEQYAMSGKAPTKALQSAFSAFAKWMKEIYKTLKNFVTMHGTKPLDAELTQYFDRMLATDEELEAARAERGFQTLFKNLAESGMSPGQFADYMALDALQKTEAEELLRSRSIRDMKWLSNAKSKAIKEIQAEADELRNLVRAGVEEELANTPIRQAERWLRKGEMVQDGEQIKATAGFKLDSDIVKTLFPQGAIDSVDLSRLKQMMASTGTQHPDDVAKLFDGFRNGEHLVRELLNLQPFKDEAAYLTDLRMLEEHGDLATPEAIEKAADEAIHNDAHLKMVATEVWALTNRTGSVAALTKAAKAFASNLVDNTVVKKLSPVQFVNAATRAGKAAVRAMAKKDTDKAASEKRVEMVNAAAAKEAYAAEAEVRAIMTRLRKIAAYSDKHSSITSREFGVVQAVRAILAEFEIGTHGEKATKYLKTLSDYDPTLGAVLDDVIEQLAPESKPWPGLKVADLRELHAAVTGLWRVAKEVRSVELAGEKMSLDDARAQLIAKLEETGAKDRQSKAFSLTDAEIRNQDFQSYAAKAIRPENWVSMKDGLDEYGPWRRLIWNTIDRAQLDYNADKGEKLKQLKALLVPIMADMTDIQIDAPELGGSFGAGSVIGYSELLHAILHTGNTSNKTKLLVGRGWGSLREDGSVDSTKWDTFMKRMWAEGKITKTHMDFVQGVWDLLESMKEGAQKAHRATTGRYFEEIEAAEIVTPFGVYRGGYAPAIVDRRQVADMDIRKLQEAAEMDVVHSFDKPASGFTKSRVQNYNQKLELNIAALGRHIDQVLLFSRMSGPVRNVQRVLKGKDLSNALAEADRAAMAHVLAPWLHSAATQVVTEKGKLSYENMTLFTKLRSRAGMALMFANVSNSMQQLTSFFPAMLEVGKKDLLFAAAKGWYKPREMAASIAAMSPYMKQRLDNEVHAMAEEIDQILLNPTKFEKAQDWAVAHSYFLQMAVDTVMSPIIWQAKFNEATARGAEKQEAIDLADSAVRKSQGSNRAIDIAAMEKGSPFYRMFMQFAGYFNSQINLIGEKLARERMLPKTPAKYGRIAMILAQGWWAPAIASMAIALAMRGGPDDEDGDGLWDDWLTELLLGTVRYATASIPVFGQAINATVNAFNDKPYDDRMSLSPAVSLIDASIRGGQAAVKSLDDPTKAGRAVRDLGSFLSLFGVPVTPITKAVGYATDVETGKVDPTSGADYARGIVTGVASPESK